MKVKDSPLFDIATEADLDPVALQGLDGGLLVTERGARVLGIFFEDLGENLLWTPGAMADVDSARQYVQAGEWNLGGDRCWIAPELELHFKDPKNPSHDNYAVPTAIDNGRYGIRTESATGVVLHNAGEATNLLSGKPFGFEINRRICLCRPPMNTEGVHYVGYELASDLTIRAADRPDVQYGLWQLMQIPPGGQIYIPVRGQPEMLDYFQTNVAGHCTSQDGAIVFPVTGQAQHKLGLRAADVSGLMGYYRPVNGQATLIVRQAAVFSGGQYADYPASDPKRRDIALQFYNDGGDIGGFGEMEYHSTAAMVANFFHTRDISRTWCFAGPADKVQAIARDLLGVQSVG